MSKVVDPPLLRVVGAEDDIANSVLPGPLNATLEMSRSAEPLFTIVKVCICEPVVLTVPKSVSSIVDGKVSLLEIELPKPVTSISGLGAPALIIML